MNPFEVVILSPEGIAFEGEVLSLYVPSSKGPLGILPGYTPTISPLVDGVATIVTDERLTAFFGLRHGVLEVKPEKTFILVHEAKRCSSEQEAQAWLSESLRNRTKSHNRG